MVPLCTVLEKKQQKKNNPHLTSIRCLCRYCNRSLALIDYLVNLIHCNFIILAQNTLSSIWSYYVGDIPLTRYLFCFKKKIKIAELFIS